MPAASTWFGAGHSVGTVPQAGWAGLSNGKLLAKIADNYDAFTTVDKNLPAQQKATTLPYGLVIVRAPANTLEDLKPLVPQILAALSTLQSGQVVRVARKP